MKVNSMNVTLLVLGKLVSKELLMDPLAENEKCGLRAVEKELHVTIVV
jgi:hypothetical protein